jgi:flagellar biosynthetic protein FliQ
VGVGVEVGMVYDDSMLQLVRDALLVTLKISGPILAAGIVVGLIVSIFQAVTSIQDQALAFVPKIIVMVLVTILLLGWIVDRLITFATQMFVLV